MTAVLGRGAITAAQAASKTNWKSVGERALQLAKGSPDVLAKAEAYVNTATGGSKTLTQLATSKSPVTQTAVMKALFESGLAAVGFAENAVLTAEEASQYSGLIAQYRVAQQNSVDVGQASKPSTSDPYLDRLAVNIDIKKVITLLGISSDDYAHLVRCMNTHTSKDIEVFQLDRVARGERYL